MPGRPACLKSEAGPGTTGPVPRHSVPCRVWAGPFGTAYSLTHINESWSIGHIVPGRKDRVANSNRSQFPAKCMLHQIESRSYPNISPLKPHPRPPSSHPTRASAGGSSSPARSSIHAAAGRTNSSVQSSVVAVLHRGLRGRLVVAAGIHHRCRKERDLLGGGNVSSPTRLFLQLRLFKRQRTAEPIPRTSGHWDALARARAPTV